MRLINLCEPVTETNVLLKFLTEKMCPFLICLAGFCGKLCLLAHCLILHEDTLHLSAAVDYTQKSIKNNLSVNVALF